MNLRSFSLTAAVILLSTATTGQWVQTNGPYGCGAMALAASASHLFAGIRGGGVYHSTNNGTTWTPVNSGLTNFFLYSLLLEGTDLFAGTEEGGVFRSTDYGAHWSVMNEGLTDDYVYALGAFGTHLFAGTRRGVFVSTDRAASWTAVNAGFTGHCVFAFAVSGTRLYAGTGAGCYLSNDSGATWSNVSAGLPFDSIHALAVMEPYVFAATRGLGVFRSSNNGGQWEWVSADFSWLIGLALASDSTVLYVGTFGGGIGRSTDFGEHWVFSGLDGHFVWDIVCDGGWVFAATAGGIYRTSNQGGSWTEADSTIIHSSVCSMATRGTTLFASAYANGVARSTNNGNSWTPVNSGLSRTTVTCLAARDSSLLAGTFGAGVRITSNDGMYWNGMCQGLTNFCVTSLLVSGTDVFAGTLEGLFRRSASATSWTAAGAGLPPGPIDALTRNSTSLFAGVSGNGVYRSTDNGTNWSPANVGISNLFVQALFADETCLLAGTVNGVFRSTDSGANWGPANTGLTDRYALSFTAWDGNLFVGTASNIAYSTNRGATWVIANEGLTYTWIGSLVVDEPYLYAGTGSGGVWRRPLEDMIAPRGSLVVVLSDAEGWGSPGSRARVVLYDRNAIPVAEQRSDTTGTATFAATSAGVEYSYRVYVTDAWKPWGEQYWGEKAGITVLSSRVVSDSFTHNTPYMPAVHVFIDSTNEVLLPGARRALTPGTGLRVELQLKNPAYPGALDVAGRGALYFDSDRKMPYDVSLTTSKRDIPVGTTATVVFQCTAPATPGDYHFSVAAYASSARYANLLTDASSWYDPAFTVVSTSDVRDASRHEVYTEFALRQNYPNPFNSLTVINFQLPVPGRVLLTVHDLLGREVAVLVNETKDAGVHAIDFDASGLSSGLYLYRFRAGGFVETRKLVVLR